MKTLRTILCASVVALGLGACNSNVDQIQKFQDQWASVQTDADALAVAQSQKEFIASLDYASLDESEYDALARMDSLAGEALLNVSEETRQQIAELLGMVVSVDEACDSAAAESTLDLGEIQD